MAPVPPEQILRNLGITDPADIDLEAIAWHLGAKIRYRPLDGCEARIVGNVDRAIITVNSRSIPRRQRFSIAHELGHWMYHRGQKLPCETDGVGAGAVGPLSPERVADRFAGGLIMPAFLLDKVAKGYAKANFQTVRSIAETFNASVTATAIRLVEGDHMPAVLISHGTKGRKWFTRARSVPERWFPADDLSPDSFAFDILFGGKSDDPIPRKVGADAWFDRWGADRFEVHEQSIKTAADEILSLILISDERMLAD